jgi:hypothetical protein
MKRFSIALLAAILVGCGSQSGPGGGSASEPPLPATGDLADLDGLPLEEFLRQIVPYLAREPGIQNPADLAAALDRKWKINCEQICRIERK